MSKSTAVKASLCPLQAIDDNVVLLPVVEEQSAGGLFLPGGGTTNRATVASKGAGQLTLTGERVPLSFQINEEVVYDPNMIAGKCKFAGQEYLLCKSTAIIAVVTAE
jgi:co-chaperonin GroES (HSP10)